MQALKSEDKSYLMQKIEWLKKDGVEKTNSPQNSQEGEKSKEERAKEADEKGSMQSEGEQIITIAFRTCEITFDILGFVVNCIDFETFFDNIKEQLLDSCENFCGGKLSDEKKQKFCKLIEEQSLLKDVQTWSEEMGRVALPVYSTDIIYNVLKRVPSENEKTGRLIVFLQLNC